MKSLARAGFPALLVLSLLQMACGGGAGSSSEDDAADARPTELAATATPGTSSTPTPTSSAPAIALAVTKLELAQTHVLPAAGKTWTTKAAHAFELHQIGLRPSLALVDVTPATLGAASLEGRIGTTSLGTVALSPNASLPASESSGPGYSSTARVADLPAAWLRPGLELRATASGATPSAWQSVAVGADIDFRIDTIPFYLFGATRSLVTVDPSEPSAQATDELYAKWPVTTLDVSNHALGEAHWPTLVIPPRGGNAAYVMDAAEDAKDGFDPIAAILTITNRIRLACGDRSLAVQDYGAIVQAKANGTFAGVGGGLGSVGGHVGAGDHLYRGIFIHEQGHAFGLPHAGSAFKDPSGDYPYPGGSLKGSVWGFDEHARLFQPTIVPASASSHPGCETDTFDAGDPRQLDASSRCIRQDPMQSGSGDQAAGDLYTIFADFNVAVLQKYFEGTASVGSGGAHAYSGGRIFESAASPTGYRRWDSIDSAWVPFDPTVDPDRGRYGIDGGFPEATDVRVVTVVFTRSNAGTAGATQIYPLLGPYVGRRLHLFDPTSAADRADMTPRTGPHPSYCREDGCDFTLRVTYAGGTVRHFAVQGAFRPFFDEEGTPSAATTTATDGASFRAFAMNVPGDLAITKVELLSTPTVWKGMPLAPTVLATR